MLRRASASSRACCAHSARLLELRTTLRAVSERCGLEGEHWEERGEDVVGGNDRAEGWSRSAFSARRLMSASSSLTASDDLVALLRRLASWDGGETGAEGEP